jgi:uncharacterized protein YndB with AHSA1/START domain
VSRQVEQEVRVDASPQDVWRALTEGDALSQWFPVEARVEPGLGGSIWLSWGGGTEGTAAITGWDPPRHFQWTEARGPIKIAVDFHVEADAGGLARVRVVQSGFGDGPEWDDEFHMVEGGWAYFLSHLQWYLGRHRGARRDLIAFRDVVSMPRAEAFERLTRSLARLETAPLSDSPATQQRGLRVPSLNDALVFVEIEPHPDGCRAALWVSTYALPADRLDRARSTFAAIYRAAFPAKATAGNPESAQAARGV